MTYINHSNIERDAMADLEMPKKTEDRIIMDMIENVYLEDTKTLDEIDARVDCYVAEYVFRGMHPDSKTYNAEKPPMRALWPFTPEEYTRSRDELKKIRPENCCINVGNAGTWKKGEEDLFGHKYECRILVRDNTVIETPDPYDGIWIKSEELAELHAIIQAIAYERTVQ